ncbi:MAG: magnesium transporter CorA family protein [Chloroflexota bacterium]|nr:magnesium transporter CorA family protein [Chloroflexota bacterium]
MSIVSRLFDADGTDREVEVDASVVKGLTDHQLLWADVMGDDERELRRTAELFSLEEQSLSNLLKPIGRPRLSVLSDYFEVNVVALGGDDRPVPLDLFAGANWVVTVHRDEITFLGDFRDQLAGDTELGRIEAPSFLAGLLDWQIGTYFESVDDLERSVDVLDERALSRSQDYDERFAVVTDLVRLRHRIGKLRRMLTPHRAVFAALARPDFEVIATSDSAAHFRAIADRLERAIDAVENARDLLIGSFDLYMTQTAQRTNDVMRILTIVNVVLLPAVVLAGIMGMNFNVGFFENANLFWVVLAVMVAIAAASLALARWRHWL